MSVAAFVASGESATFRSPYIRIDIDSPINRSMNISELGKARFMLACIRHAWDVYVKGEWPGEMLAVLTDIIDDMKPIDLATFRAHIDRYQTVFDKEKAVALADERAIPRATMLYLVGAMSGWFFHAFKAAEEDEGAEWGRYALGNGRWLPLWHILDGCMSVGGQAERTWQEETIVHFAGT
jgi:hypothetical protein